MKKRIIQELRRFQSKDSNVLINITLFFLETESQVKRFINEVYCCEEPKNAEIIVNCQFLPKIFMTQLCSILQYLRDEPLKHSLLGVEIVGSSF